VIVTVVQIPAGQVFVSRQLTQTGSAVSSVIHSMNTMGKAARIDADRNLNIHSVPFKTKPSNNQVK
jgi:hypothetical protein